MKHDDWRLGGFGIYVHWPFCLAKCPYCDFNSHVRARIDQSAWADAYLQELDRAGAEVGGRVVGSVFFGGGTPSLMDPAVVGAVLDRIAQHWTLANDLEVTLEANPTSAEAERFRGYALAGVNRLSLGLQALNDLDLKRLGRQHTAAEALAALDLARTTFSRVSADLIYARQDQTLGAWEDELRAALALGPDHLSLYQLTIEDGTAFGALHDAGKLRGLPTEETAADMYDLTESVCAEAGLQAYEVSNYAKPGSESRHNLVYWRMGDYVGVGPGAHGRLSLPGGRVGTSTLRSPEAWLNAVAQGSGEVEREDLTPRDQALEYLMMSLRLAEGCDLRRYQGLAGRGVNGKALRSLTESGHLRLNGDQVIATKAGRIVLNRLIVDLSAD